AELPPDQARVDASRSVALAPGRTLDLVEDPARLLVGELVRRRQLDAQTPLLARAEPLELAVDIADLAGAAFLDDDEDEVAQQLVRLAEHLLEQPRLRLRIE